MAKLTRAIQKIFGLNAGPTELGKIGSLADGTPVYTSNPTTMQALSNFESGLYSVMVGANSPAAQDLNSLFFLTTRQIAYLMQTGVAEWQTDTVYYKGSMVNDGNGNVYVSYTDNNSGNAVTDTTKWFLYGTTGAFSTSNLSLVASTSFGSLTIALKNQFGNDPSPECPVIVGFRTDTDSSGVYTPIIISSALSLTVGGTSTLGCSYPGTANINVYLINNAGTPELAVCGTYGNVGIFDTLATQNNVIDTTTLGGPSTSASTIYSTTGRTAVAAHYVGVVTATRSSSSSWGVVYNTDTSPNYVPLATDVAKGLVSREILSSISSTFTFNGSGGTSGSTTINVARVGNMVTIQWLTTVLATSGTSSTILAANTALPTWARPASIVTGIVPVSNNGAAAAGMVSVGNTGIISFYRDAASTAFTNSTSCGAAIGGNFTYLVA